VETFNGECLIGIVGKELSAVSFQQSALSLLMADG
jgi:hypothetical protein